MPSLSVGVVFGGRSVEHDVSIITGHQIMEVVSERHNVVPIYITREGRWLASPKLNDIAVHRQGRADEVGEEAFILPVAGIKGLRIPGSRLRSARTVPLDVVVPAIHGTFGEDGTLQGLLELAAIPYTCSGVVASAVGMDKVAMKDSFAAAGLPLVPHVLAEVERYDADPKGLIDEVQATVGWPAFVKPARLGSSVGIGKATDGEGLARAIDVARRYDRRLLIERSMEGCIEINCSVLGGPGREPRASVCEQPVAWEEFLSFEDKYLRGDKHGETKSEGMVSQERRIPAPIPAPLTRQVQSNAIGAFQAVGAAGVARIDSFVREDSGETWVMEINTVPGSLSFYLWEASGLPFEALIEELLDIALETQRVSSQLMFSFESAVLRSPAGAKSG